MVDAAAQVSAIGADLLQGFDERDHQLGHVMGLPIRESSFGQLPDSFVGVEFRSVGREALQVESLRARAEFAHQFAAVGVAAVPQDEDMTRHLSEQLAEEVAGLKLADVLGVELKVQVEALTNGRDRDPGDDGDPVAPIEVMHGRSLAYGCPGGSDRRSQLEARFVGEDEVGTQPLGVFFTLGQSSLMKRRISALLRSRAFFCGFWWLHPNACRSLPT